MTFLVDPMFFLYFGDSVGLHAGRLPIALNLVIMVPHYGAILSSWRGSLCGPLGWGAHNLHHWCIFSATIANWALLYTYILESHTYPLLTHTRLHTHIHTYRRAYRNPGMQAYRHAHIHTHAYGHTHVNTTLHAYKRTPVRAYIHTYTYAYARTHSQANINRHTSHTHRHL